MSPLCLRPAPSAAVLGVPLALTDYERTLDWIDAAVAARHRGYVCVAAVHTVMACQEDPELRAAVLGADFTVPDGQPLVWALRALGHPLERSRLRPGADGPRLRARRAHRPALLPLRRPQPGRARRADARCCGCAIPGLKIVGGYAPPFRALTDAEEEARSRSRSSAPAPTSCGSASACPSRRSGWRGCATGSTRPC